MSDESSTLSTKGLDKILKILKSNSVVNVGILGNGGGRSNGGPTNAEIGAWHEFGTSKMPRRSWLRDPLMDNLDKKLKDQNLLDPASIKKIIADKSPVSLLEKIGIIAESIIAEGFRSDGFGKWAPWSPGYDNNTGNILVNTTQLRNSVTSEVVERD